MSIENTTRKKKKWISAHKRERNNTHFVDDCASQPTSTLCTPAPVKSSTLSILNRESSVSISIRFKAQHTLGTLPPPPTLVVVGAGVGAAVTVGLGVITDVAVLPALPVGAA